MAPIKSFKRKHAFIAVALILLLVPAYTFIGIPILQAWGATTSGPLSSHNRGNIGDEGEYLLSHLPPLRALSDNSLRVVVMPTLRLRIMAFSLSEVENGVVGQLVVFERDTGQLSTRKFQMGQPEFDALTKRWDNLTDGHWGEIMALRYDGTIVGFERKRGSTITAAIGNSCHYSVLTHLAAVYVGPYAEELLVLREPYYLHEPNFRKVLTECYS